MGRVISYQKPKMRIKPGKEIFDCMVKNFRGTFGALVVYNFYLTEVFTFFLRAKPSSRDTEEGLGSENNEYDEDIPLDLSKTERFGENAAPLQTNRGHCV